ncbi:hypothetical protein A4R62_03685 [Corynebacterium pseudotuberculosis]|nr:hypothetical protein A4R72_03670 [Corynebacterium pseudotuberculosis]APB12659.1 hypothetical protein A4R71_03685 [Corynebacterium pseudotuberculosis]APB14708.1 hypothetical protein A4R68_03680 [Corynebacterium pseudotuberculosis]APB16752.1 hypothetical protein A4R67_03675 [Corynebacterium pseudotuberculosis]APB18802.1 hypothetical protein A4R66_03680 [Corynebacterium pseudotuberculosis]
MTYLLLALFIGTLIFVTRVAKKRGYLNSFSIVAGGLAVIGFLTSLLIVWRHQNKSSFIELVVALAVLLVLLPVTSKLFSTIRKQKLEKRK